jgi:hypothetical protein
MRVAIAARMEGEGDGLAPMPPNGPQLSDRQKEILSKWADADGPLGPPNLPPRVELSETLPQDADEQLTIRLFVEDPDGDVVWGELRYGNGQTADGRLITRGLHSGAGTHVWDTSSVAPGTYEVAALLRDDSRTMEVAGRGEEAAIVRTVLGTVTIAHASGNTAPEISFDEPDADRPAGCPPLADLGTAPQRDALFHAGRAAGEREVKVYVFDADSDALTVTFSAVRGIVEMSFTEPVSIANCVASFTATLDSIPDATNWRIKATVSDGTDTRSALSPPFIVSHATTSLTAADVESLFWNPEPGRDCEKCASCHHDESLSACQIMEYTNPSLDVPSEPGDSMVGWHGRIYRQVVEREEMPPESGRAAYNAEFTDQERALIGEWILGGAP